VEGLERAADSREAAPGNGARCLPTSMLRSSRPKGAARHRQRGGMSRHERRGMVAAILMIIRRRKTMYEGFCDNVLTPRPEGSSNGDHARLHRYPLSTCTHNIIECEPGTTRRLGLETRIFDGRAIGGWSVRPLVAFREWYPGTRQKRRGNGL
jgi:hypothetical protein